MPIYRAQMALTRDSQIPRDTITNTWHFQSPGPVAVQDEMQAIFDSLQGFYADVRAVLAATISTAANAHMAKIYDLSIGLTGAEDDVAGPPSFQSAWSIGPTAADALPSELAVALSMSAGTTGISEEEGATRPANRRRGRVFIGPLAMQAAELGTANEVFVRDTTRTVLLNAAAAHHARLVGRATPILPAVYSAQDGLARPVLSYSVDNAFDVQRRRGVRASLRQVLPV